MTGLLQKLRDRIARARRFVAGYLRHFADTIDAPKSQGIVS